MSNNQKSLIIKEYFNIISPLLSFEDCERINEIERQVLSLLCEVKKCNELTDECWLLIDETKNLRLSYDASLPVEYETAPNSFAYDIKTDILSSCNINRVKKFDEYTFIEGLKARANAGARNACKLLAVLNWTGLLIPRNHTSALNIWETLATNGDWVSIEMLAFGYEILGDNNQVKKWKHIYDILENEYEAFSAIASYSNYKEYTEEEVQTANLIMLISQNNHIKGTENIDRAMTHYIINSKTDYSSKLDKLSAETNYYLAAHIEDKKSEKRCGF